MNYDSTDHPIGRVVARPALPNYKEHIKPVIDALLALIALLLLAPIMLPVAILLLATGEHSVIYRQVRLGHQNNTFKIWKFVTMRKGSSKMGAGSLTLRNDPRVLPVGKYLRITKINEVPQIVNVLIGNMSIVGPRPLMNVDFMKFPEHVQRNIYNVKPGITGIGSIIFRDEEKWISNANTDPHEYDQKVIAPYKGELELWYQANQSFVTDLKILFCTFWVVLFSSSNIPYKIFKGLPERPKSLMINEKEKKKAAA
jgi:lipopolysaccharide/colanic/teichoic acid biosynthesis glycosyltransferase